MEENKRIILEEVEINGNKGTYAYQIDNGIWRDVTKSIDGTLWLGEVVKYENLEKEIVSVLRSAAKKYKRYVAPIVEGVSGISRAILK